MSFVQFKSFIQKHFGKSVDVTDDAEEKLYRAIYDEWEITLGKSSKSMCFLNVRTHQTFVHNI